MLWFYTQASQVNMLHRVYVEIGGNSKTTVGGVWAKLQLQDQTSQILTLNHKSSCFQFLSGESHSWDQNTR
jgi:hypothetical protein